MTKLKSVYAIAIASVSFCAGIFTAFSGAEAGFDDWVFKVTMIAFFVAMGFSLASFAAIGAQLSKGAARDTAKQ